MEKTQEQLLIEEKQEQLVNQIDLLLKEEKELVKKILKYDAEALDNSIIVRLWQMVQLWIYSETLMLIPI